MRVLELINTLKQFDLDKKIIFYKLEKGGKTKIKIPISSMLLKLTHDL